MHLFSQMLYCSSSRPLGRAIYIFYVCNETFIAKLANEYQLSKSQINDLEQAKAQTNGSVAVQFDNQKTEKPKATDKTQIKDSI